MTHRSKLNTEKKHFLSELREFQMVEVNLFSNDYIFAFLHAFAESKTKGQETVGRYIAIWKETEWVGRLAA